MTDLDECEKTLVQIGHEVREGGFEERIGDLLTHGEKLVQDARAVADAPDVATLVRAARGAVDAVNHAGEQLEKAQAQKRAEEKARFNKLLGRFPAHGRGEQRPGVPKFARKAGGGVQKPLFKVKRVSTVPVEAPPPPPVQPRIIPKGAEVAPDAAQRQPARYTCCYDARHGHEKVCRRRPAATRSSPGSRRRTWASTLLNYMISPGTCTTSRR